MPATSIRDYLRSTVATLQKAVGSEAEATARIIFEDVAGYDRRFIFAEGDRGLSDFRRLQIDAAVARVLAGEPVQYAVGRARFMGMDFIVNPSVLIPRPETEGLVDMIIDRLGRRSDLRGLDAGTGSGCIAVALSRALPFCRMTAIDFSDEALLVAKTNAETLKCKIDFRKADILDMPHEAMPVYDFIVSNPPYIRHSEAADMEKRVLDWEPGSALFVPDDDPLLFYRALARYGLSALTPGGSIFFEINKNFPDETVAMLIETGYADATASRDYLGAWRFVSAVLPKE